MDDRITFTKEELDRAAEYHCRVRQYMEGHCKHCVVSRDKGCPLGELLHADDSFKLAKEAAGSPVRIWSWARAVGAERTKELLYEGLLDPLYVDFIKVKEAANETLEP